MAPIIKSTPTHRHRIPNHDLPSIKSGRKQALEQERRQRLRRAMTKLKEMLLIQWSSNTEIQQQQNSKLEDADVLEGAIEMIRHLLDRNDQIKRQLQQHQQQQQQNICRIQMAYTATGAYQFSISFLSAAPFHPQYPPYLPPPLPLLYLADVHQHQEQQHQNGNLFKWPGNLPTGQHSSLQTRRSKIRINPIGNFSIQGNMNLNDDIIQKIPEKFVANREKSEEWSDAEETVTIKPIDADDQMREDSGISLDLDPNQSCSSSSISSASTHNSNRRVERTCKRTIWKPYAA